MPAPSNNNRPSNNRPGSRPGGPGGDRGGNNDRRGGRRGNDRRNDRKNEPKEYDDATLAIDRVTRVVKGGRRMRFRAVVVLGNRKGKVGLGTGKATEVQAAIQKATRAAKRAMIRIPLRDGTIPHDVTVKFKAAKLLIMPASAGTGIIAGGALRVILDLAGVKDVLSKRFGTKNKLVNAQAAMLALQKLKGEIKDEVVAVKGAAEIKVVSKDDVMKSKGLGLVE